MRAALVRGTMVAVASVIAIVALPGLVFSLWMLTRSADELTGLIAPFVGARGVVLIIALAALQVVGALWLSSIIASRRATRLTAQMSELAARAEAFSAGASKVGPMESGIDEIDRVSEVIARSASDAARQLAQQRDFAADASHQLRTPLAALLLRLEEIAGTDELEVARVEAGVAIDQVERLSSVVDELLSRSRSRSEIERRVSLDSVLASLQREWQPAFAHARRSIRVHGERGLYVEASPSAVSQIVSTLIENSLLHGRGTVDVHARRSGPSIVLETSDQGVGVAPELAPHIFERSVSSVGSGLGLALARDLAAANGGRLELVSAQPAVFAVFLGEASTESSGALSGSGATPANTRHR